MRCLSLINRKEEIKKKGFSMEIVNTSNDTQTNFDTLNVDFSKIKIGAKTLDDAIRRL